MDINVAETFLYNFNSFCYIFQKMGHRSCEKTRQKQKERGCHEKKLRTQSSSAEKHAGQ